MRIPEEKAGAEGRAILPHDPRHHTGDLKVEQK
jgi:hypothetical protein